MTDKMTDDMTGNMTGNMTGEKDPHLQLLFAQAEEDLPARDFTAQVMARTASHRRIPFVGIVCVVIAAGLLAWLLTAPLQIVTVEMTAALTRPLVAIDGQMPAQLLAPVNNVGAVIGLAVLALLAVRRRLAS